MKLQVGTEYWVQQRNAVLERLEGSTAVCRDRWDNVFECDAAELQEKPAPPSPPKTKKPKRAKSPKPINSEVVLERYLTVMNYFATGEGMTFEINVCFADSEAIAKLKHLEKFYTNNKDAQAYFERDVEVMLLESEEAKQVLTHMFNDGQGLYKDLLEGGVEFYLKYYVNKS